MSRTNKRFDLLKCKKTHKKWLFYKITLYTWLF